jgi:hypothetical protein
MVAMRDHTQNVWRLIPLRSAVEAHVTQKWERGRDAYGDMFWDEGREPRGSLGEHPVSLEDDLFNEYEIEREVRWVLNYNPRHQQWIPRGYEVFYLPKYDAVGLCLDGYAGLPNELRFSLYGISGSPREIEELCVESFRHSHVIDLPIPLLREEGFYITNVSENGNVR